MTGRFIAAMDHSGGSTGGVLERYGQVYTEADKMEKVHAMRLRMVNSPDFNDKNIWGAILYKDTVTRGMVDVLNEKSIETFLKIDSGCESNGRLKEFNVREMCKYAESYNMYGTKMRSIIKSVSMAGSILKQQFHIADIICDHDLIPIIEPEVPIDHPDKAEVEAEVYRLLKVYLDRGNKNDNFNCILKLTPPEVPNLYHNLLEDNKFKILKVVFLSGGYPTMEACRRLSANNGVSASFSRALSEGLTHTQTDEEFNAKIKQSINMIVKASE
tara:strand:+ start:239 stop:1054 length:816 start_codon:yes stop_codon:yes gene_type:complete